MKEFQHQGFANMAESSKGNDSGERVSADQVFHDPVAYLSSFGITAALVEINSPLPAAA